jgi:hypothetical protein
MENPDGIEVSCWQGAVQQHQPLTESCMRRESNRCVALHVCLWLAAPTHSVKRKCNGNRQALSCLLRAKTAL